MSVGGWESDSDLTDGLPPLSPALSVEFGAQSARGRARPVNEDHYVIIELGRHQRTLMTSLPESVVGRRFDELGYAMVVADGMGGSGTGETASRVALSTLLELAMYYGRWNLRINPRVAREILDRAERFYRRIDSAVTFESLKGAVPGLQTTLTAAFGAGHDLFFAHVGHSRAYLLREGVLMRLTRDHTIGLGGPRRVGVAPLVNVTAGSRDLKHVITNTIGMADPAKLKIDLERLRIEDKDRVLVCTNGVTDALEESEIATILKSGLPPGEQCQTIVDRALDSEGQDDTTALIAHYHFP